MSLWVVGTEGGGGSVTYLLDGTDNAGRAIGCITTREREVGTLSGWPCIILFGSICVGRISTQNEQTEYCDIPRTRAVPTTLVLETPISLSPDAPRLARLPMKVSQFKTRLNVNIQAIRPDPCTNGR